MNVDDEEIWRDAGLFDKIDKVCRPPENSFPSFTHQFFTSLTSSSLNPITSPVSKGKLAQVPVGAPPFVKSPNTLCKEDHWKGNQLLKQPQSGRRIGFTSRDSRRQWKAKKTIHKMVLGFDVGFTETCSLAMCRLVGRLSYNYLCKVSLLEWIDTT
jgi:hypothetical protein